MFDTLLIANRGEIACRIIRSCRELGLRSVAVYSDADADAPHVLQADVAVRLGPAPAAESYLRADAVLEAALAHGAGAVHPGYGFLSENAGFARAVEAAGLAFVGPTPDQLEVFGDKHTAREAAAASGVPLLAGSGLLADVEEAIAVAATIGYPVMLKAVGGGGGIGMQACHDDDSLRAAFTTVARLARTNFGSEGMFLERFITRARHVEVQMFGDGEGRVLSLGDRDCSLQRRNQKVIEEAPAPALPDAVRELLHTSSRALAASVAYRSAGTVEFVYDAEREEASFLEVNTRLQVEHPVTEAVTGVDLVAWMIRLAQGEPGFAAELHALPDAGPVLQGHAMEARVYAEDPYRGYAPSAGLLTEVVFPADVRVDTWVETGQTVSPTYDPMIAKLIVHADDRGAALDALARAAATTRISGIRTNLDLISTSTSLDVVREATHHTGTLGTLDLTNPHVEVERAGVMTTVQDWPGRLGLWDVGIPPSGPMDDLSFRMGNTALGNPEGAPGLECTLLGPRLRFGTEAVVCVTGASAVVTLDGVPVSMFKPVVVPAGGVLDVGPPTEAGLRTYVLFRGGLDVPDFHGSASTFTLGGFGGYTGRPLAVADVLEIGPVAAGAPEPAAVPPDLRPTFTHDWQVAVQEGPQPAPEYFLPEDMAQFYDTAWTVQAHANRTGIRLSGPAPRWARSDGGEAGLHPSNLHDNPYSVGSLNVSGDTPILLGPDGPSLGGFACPLTVVSAQRWKLGQIRPGDRVHFVPVPQETADALRTQPGLRGRLTVPDTLMTGPDGDDGVLLRLPAQGADPREREYVPTAVYRRGGDDNLLVEYGEMALDLGLRMRVHALSEALKGVAPAGLIDITPGVRSLHLHVDPDVLPLTKLVGLLRELEPTLPSSGELSVPSRALHLPMSWDDPTIAEAVARYTNGVRAEAPWMPSNIEFIRRINGLESVEDVRRTVFDAEYLVLGLGDVYLGAPLAVPLDPRHRLVTTKYNPARTWTASDTVGLGGMYLCVYGMDSPGGYQLVGRTVPIWSGYRQRGIFEADHPWLLRFFDRIVWDEVGADELLEKREDFRAGRLDVQVDEGTFSLAEHHRFLDENATSIASFAERQELAFEIERQAWEAAGEFDRPEHIEVNDDGPEHDLPEGASFVEAPMVGSVWRWHAEVGAEVNVGDVIVTLEAMKLELEITASTSGTLLQVLAGPGASVQPGAPLAIIQNTAQGA